MYAIRSYYELRAGVKAKAELSAEERVLDALVGATASDDTKQKFRKMLRSYNFV